MRRVHSNAACPRGRNPVALREHVQRDDDHGRKSNHKYGTGDAADAADDHGACLGDAEAIVPRTSAAIRAASTCQRAHSLQGLVEQPAPTASGAAAAVGAFVLFAFFSPNVPFSLPRPRPDRLAQQQSRAWRNGVQTRHRHRHGQHRPPSPGRRLLVVRFGKVQRYNTVGVDLPSTAPLQQRSSASAPRPIASAAAMAVGLPACQPARARLLGPTQQARRGGRRQPAGPVCAAAAMARSFTCGCTYVEACPSDSDGPLLPQPGLPAAV